MHTIIPLPVQVETAPGTFHLSDETVILADQENQANAAYLQRLLAAPTGFPLPIHPPGYSAGSRICLQIHAEQASPTPEGYILEVQPDCITLESPTATGIFYAIQTLRQALPVEVEERQPVAGMEWRAPCLKVTDWPRFRWRGFMLDEGRHFHGKQTVKLLLELMALQKLNVFHWHLTEDQGWRIESRKYPRLTEVGSRRAGTRPAFSGRHNGSPHAGFYSQDDLREVVAYAAERQITIVPEIEIPGHSLAALAAYPGLSCSGGPFEVATGPGIYPDIYCAGKEATFSFLEELLEEVLDIFPSPVIHIGGDEAPKQRWKACRDCQRRIQEQRLKDEHDLQVYFTNRIARYLQAKGRRIAGWNQILEPGLAPDAIVQYWWGNREDLLESIRKEKRNVVMSTYLDTYLDHSYSLMPLSRAYHYEPLLPELTEDEAGCITGLEFPLWTEWVPDRPRLDYQAYPRLTAMAETAWTPRGQKEYGDFLRRLEPFLKRLGRHGIRHASLQEAEPSRIKRLFGIFTISQPQRKTAKPTPKISQ